MSDLNKQIDDTSVPSHTTKSGKEVVFDPEVLKALIQQESNRARTDELSLVQKHLPLTKEQNEMLAERFLQLSSAQLESGQDE